MKQHVLPDVKVPTSIETKMSMSRFVREPDHSLLTIHSVLEESHNCFFKRYRATGEIPDVKDILDGLKHTVLSGCNLVFSGLAPVSTPMQETHFWKIAEQFGAFCELEISDLTTHVISYRCDTSKVLCAFKRGLQVVTPDWIMQSAFGWERLPEENFHLANPPKDLDGYIVKIPIRSDSIRENVQAEPEAIPALNLELADFNKEIDDMLEESDEEESSSSESEQSSPNRIPSDDNFEFDESIWVKRRKADNSSESEQDFDSDAFMDEIEQEMGNDLCSKN